MYNLDSVQQEPGAEREKRKVDVSSVSKLNKREAHED
jgi:hypothetical protein